MMAEIILLGVMAVKGTEGIGTHNNQPSIPLLLLTSSHCHPQKLLWADRYWTDDNIWDLLGGLRAVINGGLILALVACFRLFQRQPR
jgi:hypothetical protein